MIHLALFLGLIAYTIHETDGTNSKVWVIGDMTCSSVCASYKPGYTCDLTQQANMTREECGQLWTTGVAGYDPQKHERNSNSGGTVWPFAADSGSVAGAGAPCVLEKETGRLLYLSNNDYLCYTTRTDKYYRLCSCLVGIAPEYNSPIHCFDDFECVGNLICQGFICKPDCNAFEICSNEFAGNEADIGTLQTDVDTLEASVTTIADEISSIQTSITAININIGSNDIDIDAIKGRLDVNKQHIASLLTRVTEAETDIDDLEAAHVTTRANDLETSLNEGDGVEGRLDIIEANIVSNDVDIANLISRVGVVETSLKRRKKKSKDMLLIFLLILNALLIVSSAISCVLWNKSRAKYHQYNNTKLYSSDDENRELQM